MICRSERKRSTISRAGFREWEFSSTEKEILHGSGCHFHERLIQAGTGKMRRNNRMIKGMKSKRRFKRYLVYLAKQSLITDICAVIGRETRRNRFHLRY